MWQILRHQLTSEEVIEGDSGGWMGTTGSPAVRAGSSTAVTEAAKNTVT